MATVTPSRRVAPKYIPTPEEIAAGCEEIHAQRLARWDADHLPGETEEDRLERDRVRIRQYRRRLKIEKANRALQQVDEVADANERAALLDAEQEQWRQQAKAELDASPHSRRSFTIWQLKLARSKRAARKAAELRGTLNHANITKRVICRVAVPEGGPREMTKDDICNVDVSSLFMLNRKPKKARGPRYSLPELAEQTTPKPFKVKHDVVAFRSKRK